MHPRRDVFPTDWGLRIRMLLIVVLDAILVTAVLALLAYITFWVHNGWSVTVLLGFVVFTGAVESNRVRRKRRRGRPVHDADQARLERIVERLAIVADVDAPAVEARRERVAQSWTLAVPWGRPRIYATTALLDRLDDEQLEAVLAHELSHVVHRDAWVMTIAAAPGIWVLRGFLATADESPIAIPAILLALLFIGWIVLPFALLARLLSRYRELAADAGAARLTGSPARLASALTALSIDLSERRREDLRLAAARDLFQILPAREAHGLRRLWATHPPLHRRLRRLERLESELQTAR